MELINIFDDLKNDMSIEDIIKKYKIGLSRLITLVTIYNNTDTNYEKKISKELYNFKKQGNTYKIMAKVYNTSTKLIKYYIEKHCVENDLVFPKSEFKKNKIDLPTQDIYNMKKSGVPIEEISSKYGVSCSTIYGSLKEYCVENNLDVTETWTLNQKIDLPMKDIYDMKKDGAYIDKILRKYNISYSTLYNRLKEYCAENNLDVSEIIPPNEKIDLPMQEIYNMRKSGVSVEEIAGKYNVSYGTIYSRLKEMNLEILLYLFQCIIDKEKDDSLAVFTENKIDHDKLKD